LTLFDLVVGELLEVRSETKDRHGGDEPLGGVVLEPLDGVSEIHRELVVEIVVTLANGAESSEEVVTRSVLVIEWLVSEPMSERVDTECRLEVNTRTLTVMNSNALTWWTKTSRAAPAKKNPPHQSPQPSPATRVGTTKPIVKSKAR
jgi:hypothetical protein